MTERPTATYGEAHFQSLLEAIQNAVVVIGKDHQIIACNAEAERIFGYSRDEILGQNYLEMFLPEDARPIVAADMHRVLAGEDTRGFENAITSRDGTQHLLQWSVSRLVGPNEKPIAIVASGYEITELKRNREMLAQTEAKLQTIMDNSPVSLFVKDLEGRFTLTNRWFDEAFPYEKGFALGKKDADFLPLEIAQQNVRNDRLALEARKPIEFEEHIPIRGEMRVFLASKFPLLDSQGEPYAVCGIASEITELRRAEEERAKLHEKMLEAQRERVRELSTPLLPIAPGVVLMPLVGTLDEARAAQVLETLLNGVVAHQAEIVILDITGVSTVDTNVAMALIQTTQAAKLLGAHVTLTGVRPAAAQAIVELGIDMHNITTLASLEQGVAHALKRTRKR